MELRMKCPECGSEEQFFDDLLGENICVDCGLVNVVRPFEETTVIVKDGERTHEPTSNLGSYIMETKSNFPSNQMFRMRREHGRASTLSDVDRRTIVMSRMILSNYSVNYTIRNKVEEYLKSLNAEHVFRGACVEDRAASLTFFILKESNISVNIRTHSKYSRVERKYISRWAKRIAKHFRKAHVFSSHDASRVAIGIIDKLENEPTNYRTDALRLIGFFKILFEKHQMRFSPNKVVAVLWLTGRMQRKYSITQRELVIASDRTTSEMGLREQVREIQNILSLSKEDIYSLSISDLTSGAY